MTKRYGETEESGAQIVVVVGGGGKLSRDASGAGGAQLPPCTDH